MTPDRLTSLERVFATLSHKEPDRVPFFLLLTLHGAKELGLSIREYFSSADNVVEGQLRLRAKYRHDCLFPFFYAALETEAWGSAPVYFDDGPPNSGEPIMTRLEDIRSLQAPSVSSSPCLGKALAAIAQLKARAGDTVPIIGVVVSPFSLPVMQIGYDRYIELLYGDPDLLAALLRVNSEFCVEWANAQLQAGATAICYFDPVSSTTNVPRDLYLKTGYRVACETLARIHGPTATHLASGRCLPIVNDIAQTGTAAIGVSAQEDLAEIKAACRGKLSVIGNLNGIEMRRWTPTQAEAIVKTALRQAGPGGGFILADNHGEIPWQVPDEILMAISDAVHRWGHYPLDRTLVE